MRLVEAKVRRMKEELKASGVSLPTEEIRESYYLSTLTVSLTYLHAGETQRAHKHLLVKEATQVLAGEVEVLALGKWRTLRSGRIAEFDLGEYHNTRASTKKKVLDSARLLGKGVTGLTVTCKWVPPFLKIRKEDVQFVLHNDWFAEDYETSPDNPSNSPVLRLPEAARQRFWRIVRANESVVGSRT